MAIFDETLFKTVVAPEFSSKTTTDLALFVSEALLEVSPTKWGKWHPRGWALMTAHLLKMQEVSASGQASGGNAQLKKTKVGNLEREFAVSQNIEGDTLDLTIYGKELKRLRKRFLKAPLFVGC